MAHHRSYAGGRRNSGHHDSGEEARGAGTAADRRELAEMRKLGIVLLASGLVLLAVVLGGRDSLLSPGKVEASPQTTTVYWGPWTVNGFSDLNSFFYNVSKPCTNCYITGAIPTLEFDNGGTSTTSNY